MLVVVCPGELSQALGVEFAAVGEELGAILLGQLGAKRIDGDDEGSAIRFELEGKRTRSPLLPSKQEVGPPQSRC